MEGEHSDDAFDDDKSRRDRHHPQDQRQKICELGFVVGSEVTVVNEIAGNLIVQVKQSRLALDKTMASRIMVD